MKICKCYVNLNRYGNGYICSKCNKYYRLMTTAEILQIKGLNHSK